MLFDSIKVGAQLHVRGYVCMMQINKLSIDMVKNSHGDLSKRWQHEGSRLNKPRFCSSKHKCCQYIFYDFELFLNFCCIMTCIDKECEMLE